MADKKKPTNSGSAIGIGLALGAGVGLLMDNLAMGIAIGMALGVAFSGTSQWSRRRKEEAESQDQERPDRDGG